MSEDGKVNCTTEWIRPRMAGDRVMIEVGLGDDEDEQWSLRLEPEDAAELALRIAGAAYMARGIEVRRLGIVVNPDIEVEDKTEPAPEDLPS